MTPAQDSIDYDRIASAIGYLHEHFRDQPDLDEVAAQVHLSPFHFQRLFTGWAGVSPKRFLQYTSLQYAKSLLRNNDLPLSEIAYRTGLSGTSRLHDLFIHIEAMTPGEYKSGAAALHICYSLHNSPFGTLLIAATQKGICAMQFTDCPQDTIAQLQQEFPGATLENTVTELHLDALRVLQRMAPLNAPLYLHLKGSRFRLKVWDALLNIPEGQLVSYSHIAEAIGAPQSARAVGSAIGANPVAYLIPCHRVIRTDGQLGGYMWGTTRKTAIIGWEAAHTQPDDHLLT